MRTGSHERFSLTSLYEMSWVNYFLSKTKIRISSKTDCVLFILFSSLGASAGAGSGEFDIYRGCRRRELIRQEFLQSVSEKVKNFLSV